jgi:hypothetical protein
MNFPYKKYGRIFVEKAEDVDKVKDVIKELDEYEFEYLPNDFIGVFNPDRLYTVYTHKFDDLDTNVLTKECWKRGIKMFCWFGSIDSYEHSGE